MFCTPIGANPQPVAHRPHHNNVLESKKSVLRSIYLCLKSARTGNSIKFSASQSVAKCNDVYGSDTFSAYEIAKGFTRPLDRIQNRFPLQQNLRNAHDERVAKQKQNLIRRSYATSSPPIQVGDMMNFYIELG